MNGEIVKATCSLCGVEAETYAIYEGRFVCTECYTRLAEKSADQRAYFTDDVDAFIRGYCEACENRQNCEDSAVLCMECIVAVAWFKEHIE